MHEHLTSNIFQVINFLFMDNSSSLSCFYIPSSMLESDKKKKKTMKIITTTTKNHDIDKKSIIKNGGRVTDFTFNGSLLDCLKRILGNFPRISSAFALLHELGMKSGLAEIKSSLNLLFSD